jgi:hypothetical protein
MRITLFIVSIFSFFATIALAVFIEPKSGDVSGKGFTIPFWPFVLFLAVLLNPLLHDVFKFYLKTRVAIAKAEGNKEEKAEPSAPPNTP